MKWQMAICVVAWMACATAYGQQNGYESTFGENQQEYVPEIYSDISLFYQPLGTAPDLFHTLTAYNFQSVRHLARGYDRHFEKTYVNGIDIGRVASSQMDYPLMVALGRLTLTRNSRMGAATSGEWIGGVGVTNDISVRSSDMAAGKTVTLSLTDRRYRMGVRASASGSFDNDKWYYSATVSRRWGRDAHIGGVFADENVVSASFTRQLKKGHNLSLFALVAPSEQGVRLASTQEAFDLTGDNLYNPSWGYYGGRERNSRVRASMQPVVMLTYDGKLTAHTSLTATLSYLTGRNSYSSLAWYDAQTPYPDYYRAMPSFFPDRTAGEEIARLWRDNVRNVVQVDWDKMVYSNRLNDSSPAYVLENRIEQRHDLQAVASFRSEISHQFTLDYGMRLRWDNGNNYREAEDLLGAEWLSDIDQYLIDDQLWGDKLHNNMRDPDRQVRKGDKYGYNYDMQAHNIMAYVAAIYNTGAFRFATGLEVAQTTLQRTGNYEKEQRPGAESYGLSKKLNFAPFRAKINAVYALSPRHSFNVGFYTALDAPTLESIFIVPEYSNEIIVAPKQVQTNSVEVAYLLTMPRVKLSATTFYTMIGGMSQLNGYFDDIEGVYSNMILRDMKKCHKGVEIATQVTLSRELSLHAALSVGSHTYANNPKVDIVADVDSRVIVANSRSFMKNYRIGSSPQSVAMLEARYSRGGWLATATLNYMADSYVGISPLRRMRRAYSLAASPEYHDIFVGQRKLPSATTLDLFLLRSFRIGSTQLNALVSVRNVTGRNNIIYSGYEQMRISKSTYGDNVTYRPFDNKYTYSYGRTFLCSVTYKF